MKTEKNFKNLLKEICKEENIKMTYLSKEWIILLEKDNKSKILAGYKFDLNHHGIGEVCDDKYALYELLAYYKLPIVEHNIVYAPTNKEDYAKGCNNIEYLKELFLRYNKDVVLKVNNGTCGNNVYHITNINDLEKYYTMLNTRAFSLSLCPFIDIENEYRVIMFQNKPELIYKKELPIVYGNGYSTIKELLIEFNPEYFKSYNKDNKDIVLKEKEEYVYNWKFNLSGGAKSSFDIKEEVKKEITSLAIKVSKTINLEFGSIDIIKDKKGNYYVLEINSGVMMDNFIKEIDNGYEIAKSIYKKAIKAMFE